MDLRNFFNKKATVDGLTNNPSNSPTTSSTSTTPTKPSMKKAHASVILDSDDEIPITKSLIKQTPVQLPPPTRMPILGSPKKSNRSINKRKFLADSDYTDSGSSSSDDFESDTEDSDSGSESDFHSKKNKKVAVKSKAVTKPIDKPSTKSSLSIKRSSSTVMDIIDSDDEVPLKKSATKTAAKKPAVEDGGEKKKRTPAKKKGSVDPKTTYITEDDEGILLTDVQPKEAPKFTIVNGKSVPVFIAQQQGTYVAAPPPLKGQRPVVKGAHNCLAYGGGGPNGKKREETPLTFVISGTLTSLERTEAEDLIHSLGGKVTGAVSGRTDYLLLGEEGGASKTKKALENETKIINEDGLFKLIQRRSPNIQQPRGLFPSEESNAGADNNDMNDNDHNISNVSTIPPTSSTASKNQAPVLKAVVPPPVPVASPAKKGSLYARKAAACVTESVDLSTQSFDSSLSSTPTSHPLTDSLPNTSSFASTTTLTAASTITIPSGSPASTPGSATATKLRSSLYAKKSSTTSALTSPAQSSIVPSAATPQFRPFHLSPDQRPKINTYPGTGPNDLWVDKYKPSSVQDIVGNPGSVQEIMEWLRNWYTYLENGDFDNTDSKNKETTPMRAILLSGGPGLGKTTAATLCAKACGYQPIEFNASDTRNKAGISHDVGVITDNKTIGQFFGSLKNYGTTNPISGRLNHKAASMGNGSVIIMDEVDGATASDRGGVAELIKIIKNTQTPIICICNDAGSPKVKSLKNYCRVFVWRRPTATQIAKRMMDICLCENMKVEPNAMEKIVGNTNSDLRATLNYLQMLAMTRRGTVITYDDSKVQQVDNSKDVEKGVFELVPTFFRTQWGTEYFNNMLNIAFMDDLLPLFVQNSYLNARINAGFGRPNLISGKPFANGSSDKSTYRAVLEESHIIQKEYQFHNPANKAAHVGIFKQSIITPFINPVETNKPIDAPNNEIAPVIRMTSLTAMQADAISEAELLNERIQKEQNYAFSPLYYGLSTIYPGQIGGGGLAGAQMGFPALLGKMSSHGKNWRFSVAMRIMLGPMTHNSLTTRELLLQYLPRLQHKFIQLLLQKVSFRESQLMQLYGEEYCRLWHSESAVTGPECVAHLLSYIGISKDDWDLFNELCDGLITSVDGGTSATDKKTAPTYSNLVETRIKTALTKALSKVFDLKDQSKVKKSSGKDSAPLSGPKMLTEEQEFEQANHELSEEEEEEKDEDESKTIKKSAARAKRSSAGAKKTKRQKKNDDDDDDDF